MFQVPTVLRPMCPLPLSTLQVEYSKNMLRIGLLWGFYNSPSWFHFNCRILPRSRMMWLRTDPWNQHATPLVVRKTFLDLEEPGHRPARRPADHQVLTTSAVQPFCHSVVERWERDEPQKKDEMKGDIQLWDAVGFIKVERVSERISKCPGDRVMGIQHKSPEKLPTFQQNNPPVRWCWSLLQRLGMVGPQVRTVLSFVDVFDANVTALGFRIAAPSLRKNWERFPEGRARRIWRLTWPVPDLVDYFFIFLH